MIIRVAGVTLACGLGGALAALGYGHEPISTGMMCAGLGAMCGVSFEVLRAVGE